MASKKEVIDLAKSILDEVQKDPGAADKLLKKETRKANREVSFDARHPRYGAVKVTASVPADKDHLSKAKTKITSMVDSRGKSHDVDDLDVEFRQFMKAEAVAKADELSKANPDMSADAQLGEKVEHDVMDHMKENRGLVMEKWEPRYYKCDMQKAGQTGIHNSINPNQRAAQGISQAGAEVRDPFRSHYSKVMARNAHKEVLGQMKQMPAPKLPKKELEKWEPKFYKNELKKTGLPGGAADLMSPSPGGAASVPGGGSSGIRLGAGGSTALRATEMKKFLSSGSAMQSSEDCKKFLMSENWQPRYYKKGY